MEIRFKSKSDIFNVLLTAVFAIVSVGMMLFGVLHFGLSQTWPELVLNLFYIACLVMIGMYFFQCGITTKQFNYWCTVCLGITVLLRDILFAPKLPYYSLRIACLTLSVALLMMLVYFYARRDWKTYSKRNLWMICIVDVLIATLYNIDIMLEPSDPTSIYMMVEIWIRPTISYGLVACFVKETNS